MVLGTVRIQSEVKVHVEVPRRFVQESSESADMVFVLTINYFGFPPPLTLVRAAFAWLRFKREARSCLLYASQARW